ncbi:DUF1826 domain-containing protein [Paenirhodobacter sp.]|uniref:DUF1826 domain-containing protein n=1 Tax=Paenirhodobacter sp. TaxID=1965326 RepID=UPI003B3E351D
MSVARNVVPFRGLTEARAILQARDPSVLRQIAAPGIAAAIWQRAPAKEFTDWIEALPPGHLPRLRTIADVGAVESCVQAACDMMGTPSGTMRDMLAGDIAALAFIMAEVMQSPLLHLRLDAISTDACRRFHVDNMTARMLCTYRGAGTQLAQPGQEQAPQDVAPGAAAILRGTLWPGQEATALLHRSPPIGGTGQTRLLLVIDPASEHRPDGFVH